MWYSVQLNKLLKVLQWNLSYMDSLGTKMIVLIIEMSKGE